MLAFLPGGRHFMAGLGRERVTYDGDKRLSFFFPPPLSFRGSICTHNMKTAGIGGFLAILNNPPDYIFPFRSVTLHVYFFCLLVGR